MVNISFYIADRTSGLPDPHMILCNLMCSHISSVLGNPGMPIHLMTHFLLQTTSMLSRLDLLYYTHPSGLHKTQHSRPQTPPLKPKVNQYHEIYFASYHDPFSQHICKNFPQHVHSHWHPWVLPLLQTFILLTTHPSSHHHRQNHHTNPSQRKILLRT